VALGVIGNEEDHVLPDDFASQFELITDLAPDRPAVLSGERVLSWAQFDDLAARLAGYLDARGIEPRDRVALAARNSPAYLVALHALLKLGATPVNVNYRYRVAEVRHLLVSSRARAVVADRDLADVVEEAAASVPGCRVRVDITADGGFGDDVTRAAPQPRRRRGDTEWLLFTGGTTGRPKAVLSSQRDRLASLTAAGFASLGLDPADGRTALGAALAVDPFAPGGLVQLPAPPLMHGTGLYMALSALAVGAPVALLPPGTISGEVLATAIARHRVTDLTIVGDAFALPLLEALDSAVAEGRPTGIETLRTIRSIGAVWSVPVKRRLLAHADLTLIDRISATEGAGYAISTVTRATLESDWTGFRLEPGARLLDELGRDLAPGSGEVGTLAAPVSANACYEGDPEATAGTFRDIEGVRYAMPGDLARLDADGRLTLLGRGSSVINSGGEKVYAQEVEDALAEHPAVRDVVVLGVPDPRWGSVVGAVVSLVPGATAGPDDLAAFVAGRLAGHKKPRRVALVDEVHRLNTGKVDLRWARARLAEEDAESARAG
jgi:fatty-acyl-CoA synthase